MPWKNMTGHKLTEAEQDVLRAYRDNTYHNRSGKVVMRLKEKGYLAQVGTIFEGLSITRSGLIALATAEGM